MKSRGPLISFSLNMFLINTFTLHLKYSRSVYIQIHFDLIQPFQYSLMLSYAIVIFSILFPPSIKRPFIFGSHNLFCFPFPAEFSLLQIFLLKTHSIYRNIPTYKNTYLETYSNHIHHMDAWTITSA